jgi:hypothetical protein
MISFFCHPVVVIADLCCCCWRSERHSQAIMSLLDLNTPLSQNDAQVLTVVHFSIPKYRHVLQYDSRSHFSTDRAEPFAIGDDCRIHFARTPRETTVRQPSQVNAVLYSANYRGALNTTSL